MVAMYRKYQISPTVWKNSKSTQQRMEASNDTTWSTNGILSKYGYDIGAQGGHKHYRDGKNDFFNSVFF